jgi:hypothetical protein
VKIQLLAFIGLFALALFSAPAESAEPLLPRESHTDKYVAAAAVIEDYYRQRMAGNARLTSPLPQQDQYARMAADFKRQGLPLVKLSQGKTFLVSIGLNTHGKPCVCWYWKPGVD